MTEKESPADVASLANEIARDDRLLRYSLPWSGEELRSWRLFRAG
jgi:hypothetical protein